jgi:hypothetical protein
MIEPLHLVTRKDQEALRLEHELPDKIPDKKKETKPRAGKEEIS